jgi:methyl-accepting chemotaxis protein
MPKNESVEFFLRFLRERFGAFRTALTAFLQALALDDRAKKIETANLVLVTLDDLERAMSSRDHPPWVNSLKGKLQWYVRAVKKGQPDAGLQIFQTILSVHAEIENQKWDFADSSANSAIDFAAIYQEYYRDSRVPALFDELVAHLEALVGSGEIDSLQAIKALEKLIFTIKRNSRGDLFSTRGAWEFTQLFFKNYGLQLLENIPGLKHVVKAVRKTMSELDSEFSQVHDQVRQRLTETAKVDLPMLQYRPLGLPAPKDANENDDAS